MDNLLQFARVLDQLRVHTLDVLYQQVVLRELSLTILWAFFLHRGLARPFISFCLGVPHPCRVLCDRAGSTYTASIATPAAAAAFRRSVSVVAKGRLRRIASAKYAAS